MREQTFGVFFFIVVGLSFVPVTPILDSNYLALIPSFPVSSDHLALHLTNNSQLADFITSMNFTGLGTINSPYIIENLSFTSIILSNLSSYVLFYQNSFINFSQMAIVRSSNIVFQNNSLVSVCLASIRPDYQPWMYFHHFSLDIRYSTNIQFQKNDFTLNVSSYSFILKIMYSHEICFDTNEFAEIGFFSQIFSCIDVTFRNNRITASLTNDFPQLGFDISYSEELLFNSNYFEYNIPIVLEEDKGIQFQNNIWSESTWSDFLVSESEYVYFYKNLIICSSTVTMTRLDRLILNLNNISSLVVSHITGYCHIQDNSFGSWILHDIESLLTEEIYINGTYIDIDYDNTARIPGYELIPSLLVLIWFIILPNFRKKESR